MLTVPGRRRPEELFLLALTSEAIVRFPGCFSSGFGEERRQELTEIASIFDSFSQNAGVRSFSMQSPFAGQLGKRFPKLRPQEGSTRKHPTN
jgi:hypothetical protein